MNDHPNMLAPAADVESVVAEHSVGETLVTAHLTANPNETRPIVVFGERVTGHDDQVRASLLLNLSHDLLLMAADSLPKGAALVARAAANDCRVAGSAQREACR